MRKYTDLIIENNINEHDDILIIVDVQKEFSKFMPQGYVEKLNKYASDFKYVYQIWDSNKTDKRTYNFTNQVKSIRKNYGTKFSDNLVKITKSIELNNKNIKEGDIFKVNNNYIVKIDNNHGWFYLNDELLNLYKELKGKKVIIVGGAGMECEYDIFVSMKSFKINAIQNHEYIYDAKNSKKQKVNQY